MTTLNSKFMANYIYQNQKLLQKSQAKISISERGFLFGDGAFETCKIYNGHIHNFDAHISRLVKALEFLKINAEISDLKNNSLKLIAKNKIKNGILRISISRGSGSLGYLPTYKTKALTLIETIKNRKLPSKISIGISKNKNHNYLFFKSHNALNYVLNKIAAQERGFFDLIMLNEKNFISETSSANIFWVKNNKIYTPEKTCNIVDGTIRHRLLEISQFKIFEVAAKINELKNADEIFLTNSTSLAILVDEFDGKKLQKTVGKEILKLLESDAKQGN